MPLTGIIAEFNPFHLGHAVPIAAAREAMEGAGTVVCVMSGNCVQRGDLAIFSKVARAEAAVRCGADLVVELPLSYVLGSAERFAEGAVALLASMGEPETYLAFGCEKADGAGLAAAASALDTREVQERIRAGMRTGLSYGSACQAALNIEGEVAALLKTPNNLLGIEYLRAIHRLGANITPLPVAREGVAHDSGIPAGGYASASHLRSLLHSAGANIARPLSEVADPWTYMPAVAAEVFRRELTSGRGPASLEQIEAAVLSLLRLQEPPEGGYLDDSEGLSLRLAAIARKVGSFRELLEASKTKRYHLSRIRRLILVMCLGLTSAHRPKLPPYIRVLAAGERGRVLLRRLAKGASLPVLSRPGEGRRLGLVASELLAKESAATDLMALCFTGPARRGGGEWRTVPILVEGLDFP